VVNLITAPPVEGVGGRVGVRGGSFGTTDLTAEVEGARGRTGARLLVNRFASGGYDLTPDAFGPTAPAFADWTADLRARAAAGERVTLRLGARAAVQNQDGAFALRDEDDAEVRYDDDARRVDWSIHPEAEVLLSSRYRLTTTLYGARYQTETEYRRQADGDLYYADTFDQRYAKAEAQLDAFWSARHLTVIGAGGIEERLGGDRYGAGGERPVARQLYAFAQHEWIASDRLEVSASARLDAHADYAARLSPKLAVLVRPAERLRLRASVGSGFKAPAFRQLYLAFTNAAAGYSVFGSTRLERGLARLQAEGQLAEVFLDPAALDPIRAESSVAVNVGGSAEPLGWLGLSANAFFNDVEDLIEMQPVARRTNGQSVFGYFNLAEVYTRGVEAEVTVRPRARLEVALGYQFLQARDRAVVEALEGGTVFGRDPDGREYRLGVGDYGGLFGRSPHSATLRVAYAVPTLGLAASVRGRWRSRYGYRDLDGNGLANRDDEFVRAYAVVDATLTKRFRGVGPTDVEALVGVDNALDMTRPTTVPSIPGRRLYAGLRFAF
jgi:outer membrane receptor for ferrienterochelin and colicins